MVSNKTSNPDEPAPRTVHVLAPRMSPIVTDGVVSIVLTDDYRLNPYMNDEGAYLTVAGTITNRLASMPLRYALGTGFDPTKMWLKDSTPNGLRAMDPDWVLVFDCNPDLMLAQPVEVQNAYLATRDHLEMPELRWAADLRFMAEQHARAVEGVGKAV